MISSRKKEERQLRRKRILEGALSVFQKNGLEAATMDEIANEAGFGKATLYYYFNSKEEVFCAIMENGWKPLWEEIEETIHEEDHSAHDLFLDALSAITRIILKDKNLYRFLFTAPKAIVNMPENDQNWRSYQDRLYGSLRGLLEEGMAKSEFPQTDAELLFRAIGGLFHGILFLGSEEKEVSREDIQKLFDQFLTTSKEKK
ncbi:MAG: TetR/AcrR family transcriptional regulator [Candidatus Neomarinimicrobiota bacterium]